MLHSLHSQIIKITYVDLLFFLCYVFNFNCNRIPVTLLEDFFIKLTYNQMCVLSENDTEKLQ